MATTNANDSRPGDYRGKEARSNADYKPRNSQNNRSQSGTPRQGNQENRSFARDGKPYSKEAKPYGKETSPYGRETKPYDRDKKPYGKGRDQKEVKSPGSFNNRSKDFKGSGYNKDKDYDSDNKYGKGNGREQRMGDSRGKSGMNKDKEQQPNKLDTIKRLEKEKKVVQKKNEENDKRPERSSKPVVKQRRTNNIDWTKGYANGLYGDDDEHYTEFL